MPAATRDRLLRASWDCIRRRGLRGATSRAITAAADTNLGAIVAAPGVMALVGVATRRAVLFAAAAVASAPVAIISIATFPMVVPAALLIVAFATSTHQLSSRVPAAAVVLCFAVVLAVALALLLTGMRPYSYNLANGGSESGDYVPAARALLCLLVVTLDVAVATASSSPSQ